MCPTTLTRHIREMGQEAFDRMILYISGRIHDVNLLTDSCTVLGFNALHVVLINSNFPETITRLDTYENVRFTAGQYKRFYRDMIQMVTRHDIEIVAIICDNCLAQVNVLAQALVFFPKLGICHISYLSQMVNLVFTGVVWKPVIWTRMQT
jgi:hypothetical protein